MEETLKQRYVHFQTVTSGRCFQKRKRKLQEKHALRALSILFVANTLGFKTILFRIKLNQSTENNQQNWKTFLYIDLPSSVL